MSTTVKKIKASKSSRNGLLSHAKRLICESEKILITPSSSQVQIKHNILMLEEFNNKLEAKNAEILGLMVESADITEDELTSETDSSSEMYYQICETLAKLKVNISNTDRNVPSEDSSKDNSNTNCSAKLPKLTLPTFGGKIDEYTSFIEIFEAEVDRNSKLSEIHKFNYLFGCLEGVAKDAVRGMVPSAENYETLKLVLNRISAT